MQQYVYTAMAQSNPSLTRSVIIHLQYIIEIETLQGLLKVVARKTTAEISPFTLRRYEPLKTLPSL
jgi:hypothetical protein